METFLSDLRLALRLLRKNPAFSFAVLAVLALGIGANTAIFSVVNAVLLRPLPYPDPSRLVLVWERSPRGTKDNVVNPMNYVAWKQRNRSFDAIAAAFNDSVALTGYGEAEEIRGLTVTPEFLSILGVKPMLGRDFRAEDGTPQGIRSILLSHGLWQRRFGGDPGIVGKSFVFDNVKTTVVGVLPPDFQYPLSSKGEFLAPFIIDPVRHGRGRFVTTVARLKPGISREQAQFDMDGIARQLEQEFPQRDAKWGATVMGLQEYVVGDVRTGLLVLLGAVGLVLLIACANVANLLLVRATGRMREFAVRSALGAGTRQLIRQLVTESVVLSLMGGTIGLLGGYWGIKLMAARIPPQLFTARVRDISLDSSVLIFSILLSFLCGLFFGLAPALQALRVDLQDVLKAAGRGVTGSRHWLRNALLVAEVAIAFVLLVGAGLLLRSFSQLMNTSLGFETEHVLTARLSIPPKRAVKQEQMAPYWNGLLAGLQALPQVQAVGGSHFLPLTGLISATSFWRADQPVPSRGSEPTTDVSLVTIDYFRALQIPLRTGRLFTNDDRPGRPSVVVINEAMARQYFPNEDPIGRGLRISWGRETPYQIIGVVADARSRKLDAPARPSVFLPVAQEPAGALSLVIRTTGDPQRIAALVQDQIHSYERDQTITDLRTMTEVMSQSVARPRLQSTLLAAFAALALLLAAVGIYGVISYGVAQRTQEIGVRMALGATSGSVIRNVMGQGMKLAAAGLLIGLAIALSGSRVLESLLYGVTSRDLLTFAAVTILLILIAALAAFIPARRATRVDPLIALRYE